LVDSIGMKLLIGSALVVLLSGACLTDPPYRPYSGRQQQNGYGPQPGAPPPGSGPSSNYPTYQTNMGPAPTGPQPPPFDNSTSGSPGGVTVASTGGPPAQPPPTSSVGPPPPGYYQTPGVQPAPGAPPAPAPPPAQSGVTPSQVAGRYQCWVSGAGMYSQSSLGMITLDFNNSYSSTANPAAGTYRVDGNRVMFTGGPIASYVGVLETNRNGPLLRFRVERPNDPGSQLSTGDHVCYLTR